MDAESGFESSKPNTEDGIIGTILSDETDTTEEQTVESGHVDTNEGTEDPLVNEAFEHLKAIFHRNFHSAMVEAGRYIIDNFYRGDHRAAIVKNKTKDEPPNLKALINKIRKAPKANEEGVPSVGWFYNAVNLAAHEEICSRQGFQTFGILGHSHKLQLLHVPKLKGVPAEELDAAIQSAFEKKEELARHAYNNSLSVRDFKNYITEQHPSNGINLTELPPRNELRELDSKDLIKLWNKAKIRFDAGLKQTSTYRDVIQNLERVLVETDSRPKKGKGRFQDWTDSKNNINICVGCKNDCLYCYMKSMNEGKSKRKQPADWHNWELRPDKVEANRRLMDGLVGFPTSHDIFPEILDPYLIVLGKLLRAGNEVLIVSKPRFDCIKEICASSRFFKDRIIFRFTIGSMDDQVLRTWEPNAPVYEERKMCLMHAFEQGFRTSVSMEPMLDTARIEPLIEDLRPFVNTDIWLGTMNHAEDAKKWTGAGMVGEIDKIVAGQSPENLSTIYNKFKDDQLIKWKTEALKIIRAAQKQAEKSDHKSTIMGAKDRIYTIGHSNHKVEKFINLLKTHDIAAVYDVRSIPHSKHAPQFNQSSLMQSLKSAGIEYLYLGEELGPFSKDPDCIVNGIVQYELIAQTKAFGEGLSQIQKGVKNHKLVLMCAEKDPAECHRMILVCRHLRKDFEISHILEDGSLEDIHDTERRLMQILRIPDVIPFTESEDPVENAYEVMGKKSAEKHRDDNPPRMDNEPLLTI